MGAAKGFYILAVEGGPHRMLQANRSPVWRNVHLLFSACSIERQPLCRNLQRLRLGEKWTKFQSLAGQMIEKEMSGHNKVCEMTCQPFQND